MCQFRLYPKLTSDNYDKCVRIGWLFDLSDITILKSEDLN